MRRIALIACVAVASLTGCTDPYASTEAPTVEGERQARHPVPDEPATDAEPSIARLVARAVDLSGNWTGDTVSRRYALFARISVGQARRQAEATAARAPSDPELTRADSRSTVRLEGFIRDGRTLLVVARETLSVAGTRSRRYRVTRATVRRVARGWVLAAWEPQP